MYPTLPFGPLSLPTGPILAIIAVLLALDIAGRYGRRLGVHPDDIWNTGMIALAAGLIVARLWNVFQFWPIYRDELRLILSLRPSGFELWPGVGAAVVAGYLYLLHRALDPVRIGAALSVGAAGGGILLAVSSYMTGTVIGTVSRVPWALPYFGEMRHPVGLYWAWGLAFLCIALWVWGDLERPGRTILYAGLGYSLIRLFTDGFIDGAELIGGFRISQIFALAAALLFSLALARKPGEVKIAPEVAAENTVADTVVTENVVTENNVQDG